MKKTLHYILVLLSTIFLYGFCSEKLTAPVRNDLPAFPLKIGIVADSQLTTKKETFGHFSRTAFADGIARYGIRPSALEHLAPEMLDQFVARLVKKKVDLILFLGDAANSGCTDEINKVMAILKKYQKKVPVFMVIGNHDYLGMGVTTNASVRFKSCQTQAKQNPPLNKYQVINIFSKFNKANSKYHKGKFTYRDSMQAMKQKYRKYKTGQNDHYNYYLAGLLEYKTKNKAKVQFMFVDTSDYKDLSVDYRIGRKSSKNRMEMYGNKGAISYKLPNSQLKYLKRIAGPGEPEYRILVSHYSPKKFDRSYWNCDYYRWKLKHRLLSLIGKNKNYWLTGHSHTKNPKREIYKVGKGNLSEFVGLNTGSTTDFEPQAVLFGAKLKNKIDDKVGFSALRSKFRKPVCKNVLAFVEKDFKGNRKICNLSSGRAVYGMDKSYKRSCWNKHSRADADFNLERLIKHFTDNAKHTRREIVACIGYHASKRERDNVIHSKPQFEEN